MRVLNSTLKQFLKQKKLSFTLFDALKKQSIFIAAFLLLSVGYLKTTAQVGPGTAPVTVPTGGFRIEGDLQANTGGTNPAAGFGDWLPGGAGAGGYVLNATTGLPVNSATTFHLTDPYNTSENNFGGGLKFNDNPNAWKWVSNTALAKCDINNGLFHFTTAPYTDPVTGKVSIHTWLIVGADRRSNSGNAYIDFELLQKTMTDNADGSFSSAGLDNGRTKGDILLTLALTNGGGAAQFFVNKWDLVGGLYDYVDKTSVTPAGSVYASTNAATVPVSFPAFGGSSYGANLFVEAAIDLTALLGAIDPCSSLGVKTLFIKTKTSQSSTATIVDFISAQQVSLQIGVANAGPSQTQCGNVFAVSGQATPSPGDAVSSTAWSFVTGAGSITTVSGATNITVTTSSAIVRFTVNTNFGCVASDTMILTVKASPTVTVNSPSACAGSSATLTATSGAASPTYLWSPGGATASSITVSLASTTTYLVTVTDGSSGCAGSGSGTVTVNAATAAPGVTTPVLYCLGTTASPLSATGTSLLWYTTATGGTGSTTAPTPSTATAGNFTYYVSQTVTTNGVACEGARAAIVVTVNAATAAPGVTTPVVYCLGTTASPLSATGTSLLWYTTASGGTGSTTAPTPSTATAGNTTYYVSQIVTNNGVACEGARAAIVVTVNAATPAPGVAPVVYCLNATASPLSATGTRLLWYTTASGGTGSTTAPTPSTATAGNTTYYVSQIVTTNGVACEGARAAIVVTVNAATAAPGVTTPVVYCLGTTASPLSATGTSLLWYTAASGGTGSTSAPTPSIATAGNTTYYVSQTVTTNGVACEGARAAIVVTVNAATAAPGVAPVVYCLGATTSPLSATGTSLLWYTAATGVTGTATAPTPSTATAGNTTYYVSQTVTTNGVACEGARAAIVVTVNALPSDPTQNVTQPTCANSNGTVAVTTPTGADYEYSNNNGAYQDNASFTVASNAGYSIKVRRKSSGCISGSISGTMGNAVATAAADVVIQSSPSCTSATGTLKVVIAGSNADYDNTIYEFSNDGIKFGSNPVFTFTAGQGYNITVRRISDHTCTANASCTGAPAARTAVTLTPTQLQSLQTLIVPIESQTLVNAFPNPFSDKVKFVVTPQQSGNGSLEVYDAMGQRVKILFQGYVQKGLVRTFDYDVPQAQRRNLFYIFRVGDQKTTGKLIGLK